MARIVDLPPLPPSGGSVREEELSMKAQGWTVENGKVSIPDRNPEQDSTFQAIAQMLGKQAIGWLSTSADAMASSYIAREHVEFQGRWNDYQVEMQKMVSAAGQSGDYYGLPQQMLTSYQEFKETYKKERGDSAYNVVAPLFDKHEKLVLSEIYLTETETAKATAAKYLSALRSDQLLKLRKNPSSLPLVLKEMDPKLFQVGNMSLADSQKEYAQTVDLYIKEALAAEGVTDPNSAMNTLEAVSSYMPATVYAKYKKQIATAQKQLAAAQSSKMSRIEMAQQVLEVANSGEIVSLTADLKKNADTLESIWGVEFQPEGEIKKDDIYAKIGYVPPLYSTRLYNNMLHGDDKTRSSSAQSLIYLNNKLPPWSKSLPEDAVDLAFAYNEISGLGNISSNADLIERFNKYVNMSTSEREDIAKLTMNNIKHKDDSNKDSFERAREAIFNKPGLIWGTNPLDQDLFASSMTAYELTKFNSAIAKKMLAYTALGFSPSLAEQQAILRTQPQWGTSYGLGGEPYPTYAPIESILHKNTPRTRENLQKYIINAIKNLPRPNNAPFPKKGDMRIVFDSGEGNDAVYNILYKDKDYDQWLPYMVVENGEEVVLGISVAQLKAKLFGETE